MAQRDSLITESDTLLLSSSFKGKRKKVAPFHASTFEKLVCYLKCRRPRLARWHLCGRAALGARKKHHAPKAVPVKAFTRLLVIKLQILGAPASIRKRWISSGFAGISFLSLNLCSLFFLKYNQDSDFPLKVLRFVSKCKNKANTSTETPSSRQDNTQP